MEKQRAEILSRLGLLIRLSKEVLAEKTLDGLLQRVADAARELTGARLSIGGHGFRDGKFVVGAGSVSSESQPCPPGDEFQIERGGVYVDIIENNTAVRLTDEQLRSHPKWWGVPPGHTPLRGLLGVPLIGTELMPSGLILVSDKQEGDFTEEDEALLSQLASIVSLALSHIEARTGAERRAIELAAANAELESFSYSVSHDLRAPLRSLDGFSQALIEDYADKIDEQGKDYLNRIRSASQRMGMLIDDILKLSRATRGEMHVEAVNLSDIAQSIADELHAGQSNRVVEFVIQPDVMAQGDASLLRIALENLLGNAWKFTSKHASARIEFAATHVEDETTYYVRDDGVGFDMAYAEKLFGAFQRLHTVEEFPGTGIGLALVQRIVRRHGGRVWAEGEVERGATIYFTL